MYLAFTQSTAEWLLPKVGIIDRLSQALSEMISKASPLEEFDFFAGPLRIALDETKQVIGVWHVDFVSGTGAESWGFVNSSGPSSLERNINIGREVLERCLYVINQRLQGLMIDGAMIHRAYDNGAHTLLAGRGSIAHQLSIAYFERGLSDIELQNRAIVCVGPEEMFGVLSNAAEFHGSKLPGLVAIADSLISSAKKKPAAPTSIFLELRETLESFTQESNPNEFDQVEVVAGKGSSSGHDAVKYLGMSYSDWVAEGSPLSEAKRRILESNPLKSHPLRILGPGGAGKTLLMQLLAIRQLKEATSEKPVRLMYIVHSDAMREKVLERFQLLIGEPLESGDRHQESVLMVTTLSEYCRLHLQLEATSVLNVDAESAKQFQLEQILLSLNEVAGAKPDIIKGSAILSEVFSNDLLLESFAHLVSVEVSAAIKGHGLENDRKRYVESEKSLSILHGHLKSKERDFVFDVFSHYHSIVFEGYSVLDTDDMALSMAGRLRTPVWQLRRKKEGFDFVFVDEAQLFNENERRIFPLLVKQDKSHVPIALALDQAQATFGQTSAGLGTIGIKDITNERLASVHRSTSAIIKLAFFIIQKSTDLFGPDFPHFGSIAEKLVPDNHPKAIAPKIERQRPDSPSIGKFVQKRISELRRSNYRQIGVICHAEKYWESLESELAAGRLPFQVIKERGARFPSDEPMVSLARPAQVGGQEFDAIVVVGLEQGLVPPKINDNEALATAVEQQAIRDMYLSVTRARYGVVFVISASATPNSILEQAKQVGLVS
ncbi:UvrD-helicase domain-containing protein [Xanthomonas arboricola]|uniref:UvrD-helicase domain-containing protein n=1 Tax=Xanthomonas arboricola TaxID=56448 RepID=UPI003EBB3371